MQKGWGLIGILLLGVVSLLIGCGGLGEVDSAATETMRTIAAPVKEDEGMVTVEAVVEPARWVELRSVIGGTIAEVPVGKGDVVVEGNLLVRFDAADETLAVALAEARLDLAEARLALVRAGPRPEDIAVIEAQLEAAEAKHLEARIEQDRVHDKDGSEDEEKEDADYQLYAAREALAATQANLEAQRNLAPVRLREAESVLWSASAQEKVAQAQLAQLKAGARIQKIEIQQALVRQAEVAVTQAELALARTEVRAPFAGTVTQVDVEVVERIMPGQPAVVLAALDRFRVRTTDLTDLDVARIAEGQPLVVTIDALPDVTLVGYVARSHERSVEIRGDLTYPVYVALEETVSALRWGMTAVVEIEPLE